MISDKLNNSLFEKEKNFVDTQNQLIENELDSINKLVSEMTTLSVSMSKSLSTSSLLVDNLESNSIDIYNHNKKVNDEVDIKIGNSEVSCKRLVYFIVFLVILILFVLFLIFK